MALVDKRYIKRVGIMLDSLLCILKKEECWNYLGLSKGVLSGVINMFYSI